jgi:hypothetical protein
MATISQVSEAVTAALRARVERLASALEDDESEFTEIVQRSDDVGELAGTIREIYSEIERALNPVLQGDMRSDRQSSPADSEQNESTAEGAEDVTREELLERARELDVHGRSAMSKEELEKAVEAEESVTKEELLERARRAGVEGRSTMAKDELRAALRAARQA